MTDDTLIDAETTTAPPRGSDLKKTLDLRQQIKTCSECGQRFSPDSAFCPFDGNKLTEASWDPSGDPLIGKVVDGRYEITDVLGEGGMGIVYRVRHTTLDRHFAMKILRRDVARDAELAARFIQEAKATASIKHPHIVQIIDFGRLPDETPYYVMELLVGQTLAHLIKVGGPIPAARAARVILQIAGALGAAHEAGIVHRDMKPENIFLVGRADGGARGEDDDVRVVDFGAAKILGSGRLTKTGIVFGTPFYMSPEQASGQPVDHRADIYALGVIMYEMFTGKVPFEADTYMGVLTQHMFVEPRSLSVVAPAVKDLGALEAVTLQALAKKPEERYATMHGLAADIQRVVQFEPGGGVRIATELEGPRSRRVKGAFAMADSLELPSQDEMRPAGVPGAPRRALWVMGGLVVAVLSLLLFVATRSRSTNTSTSLSTATATATSTPTATATATAMSTATATPQSTVAANVAPSPTPLAPLPAARPAPRTAPLDAKSPSAVAPPRRSSAASDLHDPWAN